MKIDTLKNRNLKNKNDKLNYSLVFEILISLFILTTVYTLITFPFREEVYVWTLFIMWLGMMCYSLLDYKNRIFLSMFLISFFNFLIGRSLLISIGSHREYYYFSDYANIQGQRIVLFSFVIFSISYFFIDKYIKKDLNSFEENYNTKNYLLIKKTTKMLFYIFYGLLIYGVAVRAFYVYQHGYPSLYLNKTANMNAVVRKLGEFAPYFFFLFLSTMPSKKELRIPLTLWVIYLISTLFMGARFDFVIGILTIFTYVIMRNYINNNGEQWITKKQVYILGFIGLLVLAFFAIYKDFRFGNTIKLNNPLRLIANFFYEQGVNINNNKRIFQFENDIPTDRIYSFNSMISFWDRNIGSRVMGDPLILGNNLNRAYNENSLSDMLAVLVLGEEKYLSGLGVGSSYIAEVFHDFSWAGLILVNTFYAFIINLMQETIRKGPIAFLVTINIFMGFLKTPRANADLILLQIIDPILWLSIITVFLCYRIQKDTFFISDEFLSKEDTVLPQELNIIRGIPMTREISLYEVLIILKKKSKLILTVCLTIVALASGYSILSNEKEYSSTLEVLVGEEKTVQTDRINPETFEPIYKTKIVYGEHTIPNQTLVFYNNIIKSEDVLNQVRSNLDLEISLEDLRDSVLIRTKGESSVLNIEVKGIDLVNADIIVEEITELFMDKSFQITDIENMEKINSTQDPVIRDTHNIMRITLIAIVFGLIIGLMSAFISELF